MVVKIVSAAAVLQHHLINRQANAAEPLRMTVVVDTHPVSIPRRCPRSIPMNTQPATPHYVLGRSEVESQRLIKQAAFLRPSTERVFQKAGVSEGMNILDLGCGAGDVSFLAAELVGPTGSVVGLDVDPSVLAMARNRE